MTPQAQDNHASVCVEKSARDSFAAVTTPVMEDDSATVPPMSTGSVDFSSISPPLKNVRVVCLDVFRGVTIVVMIFVNLGGGGLEPFMHAGWNGLQPADCVFPFFAWIMGVTMNIGVASHAKKGTAPWRMLRDNLIRSIKLFLLGMFVNNVRNLSTGRITGVLQSFGFAYLVVSISVVLGLYCKSDVRKWQQRAVEGVVMTGVKRKVTVLTASGMVLGLVGLSLAGFSVEDGPIPINKNLWSLSFVLVVAGLASVVLCHEVVGQHAPFGWDRDEEVMAQNVLSNLGGTLWHLRGVGGDGGVTIQFHLKAKTRLVRLCGWLNIDET
ncbi:hypothetical protein DYB25_008733 [Aphanomyces astaci]|uniref:Uncharacterized protein n=1 Tax=Aphanomyces astaci TaxID=112090 RepID=A0A397BK55_APHAT|nr:hypothetical protein DYB25_008733 [Aphanomyces astaci]